MRVKPTLVAIFRPVLVRVERLGQDFLADVGPVGVGGVDEVHAQLHGAAYDGDGGLPVGRLAPDAVPDDAHGAEAQAMDSSQVL